MTKRLIIGIMTDKYMIPSWEYEFIRELKDSEYSQIALILINEKPVHDNNRKTSQSSFIFRLHKKVDKLVFVGVNNCETKKNIFELIKDVSSIRLNPAKNDDLECLNTTEINEIRKYNLDIIIKIGYGFLKGSILKVPTFGVWSFSMNNFYSEKKDTIGYYEVIRKNPVTISELTIIKGEGERKTVITRVFESTCSYSVGLNRDKLFRRASLFIPRVIKGIYIFGPGYLEKLERKNDIANSDINIQLPAPSFFGSIINIIISKLIFLSQVLKKITFTDPFSWVLLFKIDAEKDFMRNSYADFKILKPSKDKFWADPFVISKEDKYYVFVEEFIYSRNKGHISVLELDYQGQLLKVQKVIEKPYHMSYPFIFDIDNIFYMVPETGGNRTIDLYKCTDFPGKWTFVKSIMSNVNAVDSTLFYYNCKWWLFTVIDKINSALANSPELYLFYADDILSDKWTSHPQNPVVSDVRTARPAGKVFIKDGNIYRPSQDCSMRYGNSFDINQILTLTENEYAEKQVIKVRPDWDDSLKGAHTFNFDNDFTIIDAYKFRRRFI